MYYIEKKYAGQDEKRREIFILVLVSCIVVTDRYWVSEMEGPAYESLIKLLLELFFLAARAFFYKR